MNPSEDKWFKQFQETEQYRGLQKQPVAYFCAEYALFDYAPLYAGGLGILAGDYWSEMAKQNFPVVAVGLFYWHEHIHDRDQDVRSPLDLGLRLVMTEQGEPLYVKVPLGERQVTVQVWQRIEGEASLFLLDTRVESNDPKDKSITDTLYVENRDVRLMQEIILGIGGRRVLQALNIHPSVYHLNEGHSAFLFFELAYHEMCHRGVEFPEACQYARQHIVFTNHTLIEAGQELFAKDRVEWAVSEFSKQLGIPVADLLFLGLDPSDPEHSLFSMTRLALNTSSKVNAVSLIHGEKAMVLWKGYSVATITNGIFLDRWNAILGDDLWQKHQENKQFLLQRIAEQTGTIFEKEVLLIGWARRFVDYKRPLAILEDVQHFKKLAIEKNIRIVFSGPLNESYKEENKYIKQIESLVANELKGLVTFLPNYDVLLTKLLVAGCDIWLNTPIVGLEACGTSGMKACLNGVLPLTTRDGWVAEADLHDIGWTVNDTDITSDLLRILENDIVPKYYNHISKNNNNVWIEKMNNARALIINQFSTARMLKEYIEKLYLPTYKNKNHTK